MKLAKLNAAIRAAETVKIRFNLGNLVPVEVAVQKGSLIAGLADAFPDKGETGLHLREDSFITKEGDV